MQRFSLSGGVLFALLVTGGARADLHCDQPAAQVGEVRTGTGLSHRFALVNDGGETLEILDVHASCGCMTPRVDRRVYAPGGRGVLVLEINTLTQAAGPQSWRVTLRYREGQTEKELALQLAATVVTEVTITPPTLTLYTTSAIEHELTLIDRRILPMNVTAVQPSSPQLRTRLGDWQKNDEGFAQRTIALEVLPEFPEGRHEEVIQIFTADPEYRELRIPVTIVKKPRQTVSATPDSLTVASVAGEPIPSRLVLLRSADDVDVQVERVECDAPAIRCTTTAGPGRRATVKIDIDRAKVGGDELRASVLVTLRQPAGQTITVPVTWTRR